MPVLAAHKGRAHDSRTAARPRVRQIAMPDLVGTFRQPVARDLMPARVEQAQLDFFGVRREHGEVDAKPVPGRTERIAGPGSNASGR